ncbi:MAG: cyclase/dehydrase, partial [Pedosphaera sp.]|nr:cyclase/dehydrase [Pedosphaera sp.]
RIAADEIVKININPSKENNMESVEKSIEVEAPIKEVYNQWTEFERFPEFMEGVEEVRQLDDGRLHWVAEIGGKKKEWDAEIYEQIPDHRIAWRSTSGTRNGGAVDLLPKDAGRTRVTLKMDYEPEGVFEHLGDALDMVTERVEGDLERFKEFIQARGTETGSGLGGINEEKSRTA